MSDTQGTQTANMGNTSGTQDTGKGGRDDHLFTQDEVNKIIQSRMSRMKDQAGKEAGAEYQTKLQELEAREHKLAVLETLHKKGLDPELADIITCTDEKDLEDKLNTLDRIYGHKFQTDQNRANNNKPGFHVGAASPGRRTGGDAIRKAMGMDY